MDDHHTAISQTHRATIPCKLEEMLCSPFSLLPCLSSRGLSRGDSWQTYTVNLGRTDLHTQTTNSSSKWKNADSLKMCICEHNHSPATHLDLSALKSLIPSAGPQIWTRSSRVNFNKSEPTQQRRAVTCAADVTTLHLAFSVCVMMSMYLRSERRAVCRSWSGFSEATSGHPVWRQWGSTAAEDTVWQHTYTDA